LDPKLKSDQKCIGSLYDHSKPAVYKAGIYRKAACCSPTPTQQLLVTCSPLPLERPDEVTGEKHGY